MAYKYLNDDGLKAYTKKVKGALKDLHTPIAISSENTTESKAQNLRNIADFVAKAKAAGIADVNGMVVSCLINDDYSGVGYLFGDTNTTICGIEIFDDFSNPMCFTLDLNGTYGEVSILMENSSQIVTSDMLTQGARKPIILTPETTEVDEETYQKLISDDVDVVFKTIDDSIANILIPTYTEAEGVYYFSVLSAEGESLADVWLYGYKVSINDTAPHEVTVEELCANDVFTILKDNGFINQGILSSVLQEIDLTGTDAERKAKLDQFEANWKDLTGADDLTGARFVGDMGTPNGELSTIFAWNNTSSFYEGVGTDDVEKIYKIQVDPSDGYIHFTPLFSHLEPVEIFDDNSAASKKKNIDNINAYKANLEQLGINISDSFQIPIYIKFNSDVIQSGFLIYSHYPHVYKPYSGLLLQTEDIGFRTFGISSTGEFIESTSYLANIKYSGLTTTSKDVIGAIQEVNTLAKAVKAFGAIELKASDNVANKAALTAYKKILTDAGISITNGYSVSVRITGNAQEYHGILNIGTGALLSGIVTDVNETHHYPFHIDIETGIVTFDKTNYFLEKTSNEVTEMLDAIKYSYTPVPLTDTTSTNKTQLDLFLSKVPNAQVIHCTYKDVYAGTLHKINGSWYGVLVDESNTLAGQLSIKLQADGTIVEGQLKKTD